MLLIAAAGRIVWTRLDPPPRSPTEYVWLGEWLRSAPLELPAPPVEVLPVEPSQTPSRPTIIVERETVVPERPPSGPPVPSGESLAQPPEVPVEQLPARGTDWDEERRRAIAAALARQARDTEFSAFSLDDRPEARPLPPEPKPSRSIFDSRSSGGGRTFMQPGHARTKFGHRVGELCNALTGGFGFFGISFCAAANDEPSGLFPEVMPEWLKRMPECTETRPLPPLLAEPSAFPTIKCRMVPKGDELPTSR